MAYRDDTNLAYDMLNQRIKSGKPAGMYGFYGEEKFLLNKSLESIRKFIADGTESFNYKRIDGSSLVPDEFDAAVNALPMFSDYTVVEVWDCDIAKCKADTKKKLIETLSDPPEYAAIIFIYDTIEVDKRQFKRFIKDDELAKLLTWVEFNTQSTNKLIVWIEKHFAVYGKSINRPTAQRLAEMTGGSMTTLLMEIDKLAYITDLPEVRMEDVEKLVTPVLDAEIYELTDFIVNGNNNGAMRKLGELALNGEPPQKIFFSISSSLRQLLAAKIYRESGGTAADLMKLCGIKFDFQAKKLFTAAKNLPLNICADLVKLCAETALKLNSTGEDGTELLTEFLSRAAIVRGTAQ